MLSDRSYMRSDYPRQTTSALTWIICATLAGSIIQFAASRWFGSSAVSALFALSPAGISHGRIWTLVSYTLLHDGIFHLLLNCLGLFLIGREVAPLLGSRRFFQFYAGAALLGGVCWLAVHSWGSAPPALVGASAAVAAIFIFFACVYPEREITFLLFLVLPVTLKPKYIAWGLLGLDGLGFLFSESPGGGFATGIAHSAHLGGMLAGWLYFRFVFANRGSDRAASFPKLSLPAWLLRPKSTKPSAPPSQKTSSGAGPKKDLRAEVDRILDKINSRGFGALTDEEKQVLDDAKDLISRQ